MFTRQVKVQIEKSMLIILTLKTKVPTLAGNKHLSIHFFPQRLRLFHLRRKRYEPNPLEIDDS